MKICIRITFQTYVDSTNDTEDLNIDLLVTISYYDVNSTFWIKKFINFLVTLRKKTIFIEKKV